MHISLRAWLVHDYPDIWKDSVLDRVLGTLKLYSVCVPYGVVQWYWPYSALTVQVRLGRFFGIKTGGISFNQIVGYESVPSPERLGYAE